MLAALCNTEVSKDADGFVTVVRARKSRSPQKGSEPPLPQGDEFPALKSPPKRGQPLEGPVKTRKEGKRKDGHKDRAENKREEKEAGRLGESTGIMEKNAGAEAPDLNRGEGSRINTQERLQAPTGPLEKEQMGSNGKSREGGLTKAISEAGKLRVPPSREVTAEFDGLMTELLSGLRLQTSGQGLSPPVTASPQTQGPVQATCAPPQNKVVLSPQVQKALAAPPKNGPVNLTERAPPLSRNLFPNPPSVTRTAPQTLVTGPRPPTPKITKVKPPEPILTPARGPNPNSSEQSSTPQTRELSFFAVPPKTPNPYSPKSVLDLSSPEGSPMPRQQTPANQTPPAKRSAYRPAMHADPKKVIGRKAEAQSPSPEVVTSSPFSYTLWAPPLTSARLSSAEAGVLRESPCNVVKEVNPAKGSRLGAWLGKGSSGLLETESEFHQALIRGVFTQPTPFQQPTGVHTGHEDDELCCKICFERESNSTYLCGHTLCNDCAEYIHVHKKICPFCSKPIESVLRMFT
ncbi:hypothetical protein KFL_001080080 [Klebsormidium nitens]|uniref:RING-type domain-containing protein n=1 Tax=Klebsormidium nitens TaxID=105231 RepID=A0A1Y1HVZ1_KLENI|nr:hypothetical protein KFL_001080080 [Klebsormidium nitens]|eukprot:GAQ82333.1 hypothetical protein KFL_001080080 [Klebsormidium nitens]